MADLARNTEDFDRSRHAGVGRGRHVSHLALARDAPSAGNNARPAAIPDVGQRVASVDVLRGFAMFWIIAGDALAWSLHDMAAGRQGVLSRVADFVSEQLMHAKWEGLTFYDLLFPTFLFVSGVSIVFSIPRIVDREGRWAAHRRVVHRSILLFALGLIYYGGASNLWPDIRLVGILQRIALCYFFTSLLFLHFDLRGLIAAFMSLLFGYWALMTFVPVPGVGVGSFAQDANLANWIDDQYLPGLKAGGAWDAEGLLSTMPAIATCLLGVFAGTLLKEKRVGRTRKALSLIAAGIMLAAAGYLWSFQFPLIKSIWTSSFVLVAGGYSTLLLGLIYLLVDVAGYKAWATIFVWFGANAIALYMLNTLVWFQGLAERLVGGNVAKFLNDIFNVSYGAGSFAKVAVGLVLATALAGFLYQRRIFLRV